MILVQQVFQAKYGHGDALVELFKEFRQRLPGDANFRIMTDASGPFFTVVTHFEVPSLAAWEERFRATPDSPDDAAWFQEWFQRMMPLVDSGRRDFYTIVE